MSLRRLPLLLPFLFFILTFPVAASANPLALSIKESKTGSFEDGVILVYPVRPKAYLVDRAGTILHRWNFKELEPLKNHKVELFHVEPLAGGDLVACFKEFGLARVSFDGKLRWFVPGAFHHDSAKRESGEILTLSRRRAPFEKNGKRGEVLADFLLTVSAEGKVLSEVNIAEGVASIIPDEKVSKAFEHVQRFFGEKKAFENDSPSDILHTNSIEIVPFDIPEVAKKGDLLFSFRSLNSLVITDPTVSQVKWHYRGELSQQHDATFTADGNILVFDNGRIRKRSRVIKISPQSKEVVWEYPKEGREQFFSHKRGGAQELLNENLFITISFPGELREVNSQGEHVWTGIVEKDLFGNSIYRGRFIPKAGEFFGKDGYAMLTQQRLVLSPRKVGQE